MRARLISGSRIFASTVFEPDKLRMPTQPDAPPSIAVPWTVRSQEMRWLRTERILLDVLGKDTQS